MNMFEIWGSDQLESQEATFCGAAEKLKSKPPHIEGKTVSQARAGQESGKELGQHFNHSRGKQPRHQNHNPVAPSRAIKQSHQIGQPRGPKQGSAEATATRTQHRGDNYSFTTSHFTAKNQDGVRPRLGCRDDQVD
jgi:hypothetical protein